MIIDIRGKTRKETYQNGVKAMKDLGFTPIHIVCETCGEDAYTFSERFIDQNGYFTSPCPKCQGKMKRT